MIYAYDKNGNNLGGAKTEKALHKIMQDIGAKDYNVSIEAPKKVDAFPDITEPSVTVNDLVEALSILTEYVFAEKEVEDNG